MSAPASPFQGEGKNLSLLIPASRACITLPIALSTEGARSWGVMTWDEARRPLLSGEGVAPKARLTSPAPSPSPPCDLRELLMRYRFAA